MSFIALSAYHGNKKGLRNSEGPESGRDACIGTKSQTNVPGEVQNHECRFVNRLLIVEARRGAIPAPWPHARHLFAQFAGAKSNVKNSGRERVLRLSAHPLYLTLTIPRLAPMVVETMLYPRQAGVKVQHVALKVDFLWINCGERLSTHIFAVRRKNAPIINIQIPVPSQGWHSPPQNRGFHHGALS